MLNHREVLEALLAGKVVRDELDNSILLYLGTDGRLRNETDTIMDRVFVEGWQLSLETIEINGIKAPKGETVVPARGTRLFLPVLHYDDYYSQLSWNGSQAHHDFLSKGLLHLSKEDAIAHAKALLSFTSEEG
jgi:hypothetical protein